MKHHAIDYIEFYADQLAPIKQFYTACFGWSFTDYGPSYTSFQDGHLGGGFTTDATAGKGALVILYSERLEETQAIVREQGGKIVKEIFSFPGGRRFHFTDPSGNELAVWSDT